LAVSVSPRLPTVISPFFLGQFLLASKRSSSSFIFEFCVYYKVAETPEFIYQIIINRNNFLSASGVLFDVIIRRFIVDI